MLRFTKIVDQDVIAIAELAAIKEQDLLALHAAWEAAQ